MTKIPLITKNLLIVNVLMFAAAWVFGRQGIDFNSWLGLHFFLAPDFSIVQLFTYMFLHASFEHLFFNMFALWMFGCVVERALGARRFLYYYLSCGEGAGMIQEVAQLAEFYMLVSQQVEQLSFGHLMTIAHNSAAALNQWTTVGASGAVYAILLAFGMLFPNERIFIFPLPVPIKGKWFVCIYIVVELFSALATTNSSVAHFAHLGGMLFGWLTLRRWMRGSGNNYRQTNRTFFDSLRRTWESKRKKKSSNEDDIDKILDKVRRSGYDSLSDDEKRRLFDGGKR